LIFIKEVSLSYGMMYNTIFAPFKEGETKTMLRNNIFLVMA